MLNDYFKLRVELNLAQFPDDMVMETGRDVELKILQGQRCSSSDIAWLLEAAERAVPKVHDVVLTNGAMARDGF